MTEPMRVAVSGAAGQIGYALLFRIAAGAMFGPNQPVALSMLEVTPRLPYLEGIMMELSDSGFPLLESMRASDQPAEAFARADWIILLAGVHYQAGQSRLELLRVNGPTFREHGIAINVAAPAARILTVANPCNTNCLIAKSHARDVPPEHWFAMTRLDQNRARALIAAKAAIPVSEVHRVSVWGNHGSSIFPDFHNAMIGDRPAHALIRDPAWVAEVFEPSVATRGRQILAARGYSPAASAAQAIIGSIRSLSNPTPYLERFSVAVPSDGSYGVPRGLIYSFPVRTEDGKTWSIVQGLYHDNHAQERLAANVAELEYAAVIVGDLLGGAD